MPSKISDLLGPECSLAQGQPGTVISGLTLDSREVEHGMLFAAMPGTQVDGTKFIPAAVEAGAAAVLCDATAVIPELPDHVAVLRAADPRRAIAMVAARYYPRQPETIVAVTGTSGKSSVADFTRQIFLSCGYAAASIGTIGVVRPDGSVYGGLTTPDPITLQRTLQGLAEEGVTHLAFEASSHGLDQRRLDGVRIRAAGFTNLSRDHLDYHPTMEDYLSAKLRLFTDVLPEDGVAVVFVDDGYGLDVFSEDPTTEDHAEARVVSRANDAGRPVMTVGLGAGVLSATMDHGGEAAAVPRDIQLAFNGKTACVSFPLVGFYQVNNAIVAAGLALASGCDLSDVAKALSKLEGVSGRLELAGRSKGASVIVDYAHKPDALRTVLMEMKPRGGGRLISVFGCGGDRDKGKRPLMGEISASIADITIVTDDNPRTEDPARVRSEILAAAPGALEIGDRAAAIEHAVEIAAPSDVVVIAGKGHETGQIVGDTVLPFSDQEVARAAIARANAV